MGVLKEYVSRARAECVNKLWVVLGEAGEGPRDPVLLDGVTGKASKLKELKLIALRGRFVDSDSKQLSASEKGNYT